MLISWIFILWAYNNNGWEAKTTTGSEGWSVCQFSNIESIEIENSQYCVCMKNRNPINSKLTHIIINCIANVSCGKYSINRHKWRHRWVVVVIKFSHMLRSISLHRQKISTFSIAANCRKTYTRKYTHIKSIFIFKTISYTVTFSLFSTLYCENYGTRGERRRAKTDRDRERKTKQGKKNSNLNIVYQ